MATSVAMNRDAAASHIAGMKTALASLLALASIFSFASLLEPAAATGDDVWLRLVPAGKFSARDGRGPFDAGDRKVMEEIVAATRAYHGSTDMLIDYDHQSVFGAKDGVGGTAKAAGWVKELQVRDDGIYGRVKWTAAAAAAIKAEEYRYLSPVIPHDKKSGRIFVVLNVAITNTPALDLDVLAASSLFSTLSNEGTPMEKILKALGLAEGSGEDAVLAAITGLSAASTALTAIGAAAGLKADAKPADVQTAATAALADRAAFAAAGGLKADASADQIVAVLKAGVDGGNPDPAKFVPITAVTELQTQVATLMQASLDKDATDAVDAAMSAGKLAPGMRDWGLALFKKDKTAFETFASGAPSLTERQRRAEPKADAVDLADPAALSAAATAYQKKQADSGVTIDIVAAVRAVQEGKR